MLRRLIEEAKIKSALAENLFWRAYSKLFIVSDRVNWVLDNEARELGDTASVLGIDFRQTRKFDINIRQCVHYTTQSVRDPRLIRARHRISMDYFHGHPDRQPVFRQLFDTIRAYEKNFWRIRVSHSEMEKLVLTTGIDPAKVRRIPIGINLKYFSPADEARRQEIRREFGIPEGATVIGLFQKDGEGWGEGKEPKLIKGPDTFLGTMEILKKDVPNIFVLLTGPSRGFVKAGLECLGIPYRHDFLDSYQAIGKYYQAIDLYIIPAREEGGPKALLESMASGIPVVTTRVGQAIDLVRPGENALMVAPEDAAGLAAGAMKILNDNELRKQLISKGFVTASENTYESQLPLWKEYFRGFVES